MIHSFLRIRGTPFPGSMVNLNAGQCTYSGESENSNLDSRSDSTTLSSTMARFWPAQVRAPTPKGMYMRGLAGAFDAVAKPSRIKFVSVRTPYGRIPVNQCYWDPDVCSFWDVEAAKLYVVQSFPCDKS